MTKKEPKISLCMMVKNEEKNLSRLLKSIEKLGIIDEILVFDTGSTDKTVEIAESFGAKMIEVDNLADYYVETKYGEKINFSKARNKSFENASGDWLLLMDADEELVGSASNLKQFIMSQPTQVEGIAFRFEDKQKGRIHVSFPPPRLFKRGKIHYEGIVHNMPVFKDPAIFYPGLTVLHYGFDLSDQGKKEKSERTLGLLEAALKKTPNDYRIHFYLAQHWGIEGDFTRCIEHCIKYIRNREYLERFNTSIYFTLVQAAMRADQPIIADKWLGEALKELPDDIDLSMAVIDFGIWQKKPVLVLEGSAQFVRAYDKMERDKLAMGSRFVYNYNPDSLVKALFHLGTMRIQEGVNLLKRLDGELDQMPKKVRDNVNADIEKALGPHGISLDEKKTKTKRTVARNRKDNMK